MYWIGSRAKRRLTSLSNWPAFAGERTCSGWVVNATWSHPKRCANSTSASRRGFCDVAARRARAACSASAMVACALCNSSGFRTLIPITLEALGLVVRNEGIDSRLQLAFHHFGQLMVGEPDTMVGKPVLRKVVSTDL